MPRHPSLRPIDVELKILAVLLVGATLVSYTAMASESYGDPGGKVFTGLV